LFFLQVIPVAFISFDLLYQHARVASLLWFYLLAYQSQLCGKGIH
jgi:hypothetical protein